MTDKTPQATLTAPRFTAALLLAVLVAGSTWLGAVVVVNPWSEFPPEVLPPLVPNQYATKADLWAAADPAPQTLLLGSSRGQGYHPALLHAAGWRDGFNFAVGGAELDDELAVLRYALASSSGSDLTDVVVALDLFQLRVGPSSSLRLHNVAALNEHHDEPARFLDFLQVALYDAVTPPYHRDMLRSLQLTLVGHPEPEIQFDADGGLTHMRVAYENGTFTPGDPRQVQRLLPSHVEYFRYFHNIDPGGRATLADLLATATDAGLRTTVILTPMHPDLTTRLNDVSPRQRLHDEVLGHLDAACEAFDGLRVIDATDAVALGGDPDDFDDSVHVDGATNLRVLQAAADPANDRCATQ